MKEDNSPVKPAIAMLKSFTPCAHRGASGQLPGNTIEAFQRAVDIDPATLLEMDVWPTKDGHVVVFHDDDLALSTNGEGPPTEYTLEEIRSLDAGYWFTTDKGKSFPLRGKGYRIATLREVLEGFPGVLLSIDIKYNRIDFAADVMNLLEMYDAQSRVFMGSFFPVIMGFIRKQYPDVALSYDRKELIRFLVYHKLHLVFFYKKKSDVMMIPEFSRSGFSEDLGRFFSISQGLRVITKRFIRDAHRKGIPVIAWTINRPENMRRLIEWGIDGIVTDYPELLHEVVQYKIDAAGHDAE